MKSILTGEIAPKALEDDPNIVYAVDAGFRLTYGNKAWDKFAAENGAPELRWGALYGRSVLDFICGPSRDFYRRVFQRTIATGKPWEQDYECSSPTVLRRFHMQVLPLRAVPSLCGELADGGAAA